MRLERVLWLLAVACALAAPLLAGTTGKIVGRVADAGSREGLPGANIIVEGTSLGAVSDLEGQYLILR
ncbi:MAG TPA: carboxypeptidase-like regulatory domain-containing protein, partial [bacterium]|nr:carboxypeptidase-like regulatory domain-containing protein [bacterium]